MLLTHTQQLLSRTLTKTHLTQRGEVSSWGDGEISRAAWCKLLPYFNMPSSVFVCVCVCVGSQAPSMKADDPLVFLMLQRVWEATKEVQCRFWHVGEDWYICVNMFSTTYVRTRMQNRLTDRQIQTVYSLCKYIKNRVIEEEKILW